MLDAVFISDVHLGTSRCNTKKLLKFLKELKTKKLILVGDIIDIYSMEKYGEKWTKKHTECIHAFLDLARNGTKIVYILGNHEESFRRYTDFTFENVSVCEEYVHIDSKKNKYLCIHGDKYSKFSSGSWKQLILMWGYEYVSPLNEFTKKFFKFSLVNFLKNLPHAKEFINKYENDIFFHSYGRAERSEIYHGVICGHIHHKKIRYFDDFMYMCCGDWVDTCSAIIEKNGMYCLEKY